MSGFSQQDILDEGFKPLLRTSTEPKLLGNPHPKLGRRASFAADTGEAVNEQSVWESTTWSKFERARGRTMSRGNSFVYSTSEPITASPDRGRSRSQSFVTEVRDMIAVVDPFSTGAHLAAEISMQGLKCARVFSIWDSPVATLVQKGLEVEYCATVQHDERNEDQDQAIEDTIQALRALPYNIIAVIPGAETGVELADSLSHRMGLRSNGEEGSLARRNKYFMGEKVRASGTRAVKQRACRSRADLKDFLADFPRPVKCVVKPVQSAGSDDVFLCNSYEEAETAFDRIYGHRNGLGLINESALVQEFLAGKEYVVDKVSKDGIHKVVGIWEYDKRKANGASFVYFGMRSMDPTEPKCVEMIAYADCVLDALGIMHGPSHMEIMYTDTGPCLVEVGSRCQGGEGTWLPVAKECIGYTQVEVTVDVYMNGTRWFDRIKRNTYPLLKHGRDVDMVNRNGGIIRGFPGEDKIKALKSYRAHHWEVKVGDFAPPTIDCFTRPGVVQFVHESKEQADADFEELHRIEEMGLIDYSVICPAPPIVGAVVVVDAFSSGANLAAMVVEWGYRVILVFSEKDSPVANLISSGTNLDPTLIVQHDETAADQDVALQDTLKGISGSEHPVLAILPGAETGVELADKLAYAFKTRNNGISMTEQRRNKYLMQEAVREAGLRSIKQELCRTEEEVASFCDEVAALNGGKLLVVVKPNESAGSDSIFKCSTVNEVIDAFKSIHGQTNGLGQVNDGALCQEFLQGTEYVLDGVSRDGQYKVCAIWEYDKRSVNGANFVYYGMKLRDGSGELEGMLMEYAEQVVKAMQIYHGPSHMEVIMTPSGPCLVEVGSRCHGGEGTWLPVVKECIGYSQLEATLNAHLRPDKFDAMPKFPTLMKAGCEAFLVAHKEVVGPQGKILNDIPGLANITSMKSFRRVEMLTQPGNVVSPTVDCFTRPGSVQMVGNDRASLDADYNKIRSLEYSGLFSFKDMGSRVSTF